jgi:hypothetical protein
MAVAVCVTVCLSVLPNCVVLWNVMTVTIFLVQTVVFFDTTHSLDSPFRYLIKVMLPKFIHVLLKQTNCFLLYAFCDFLLSLLVFPKFVACSMYIALTVFKTVWSVSLITCITISVGSYLDSLWFSEVGSKYKQLTSHILSQHTERQCSLWALLWALFFTTVAETSN